MNRSRAHLLFMAVFGLVGWGVLLGASYVPGFGPSSALPPGILSFALFFLVVVGARSMAFRMLPETVLSADAAFYIAALVCLGSVTAGRLVALALTLDALLRFLGPGGESKRSATQGPRSFAFVLYFGGMSGGLLMAVGWLFGIDDRYLIGRPDAELEILALVVGMGAVFLLGHYLIQGVRLFLAGQSVRAFFRVMAVPGLLAEVSLLPLGAVVVVLYHPERPLGFVLLGATFLVINFVFNRLSHAQESLRQRVSELETLNTTAHALGSTLQLHDVIDTLAQETLAAVPSAELLALSRVDGESFIVDFFDRERGEFETLRTRADEGLSAWVVDHNKTLHVPDITRAPRDILQRLGDSGVRSWLGVPIVIYDEVIGVLSVQSREKNAFDSDEQRLLEAIGAQAAVAIQNARLYELATVDGLTGLYVRRYFDQRLKEELQRSRRFQVSFSLILLDIDNFKKLNDEHGHPVGDRALREIARVVRRSMRGIDIPARYGGEEFAFILPRTGMLEAHAVAERIREDVAELAITTDTDVLRLTVSVGVACYPESGEGEAADLVRRADVALYRAKAAGKNRVELFWGEAQDKPRHVKPL